MHERLTDARIDELLALEAKATPGDWGQSHRRDERDGMFYTQVYDSSGNTIATFSWHCIYPLAQHIKTDRQENAELVAASRNSIRSLLEEVRERRAAEMEILRALRSAESHYKQSENCGVCHPIGDCPTLRVISAAIARAEKES